MTDLGPGDVALVVGGTSGIGLAIAGALHRRGAKVHFCARNAERVASVAAGLPGSEGHACDVSDARASGALRDAIAAIDGGLDLLVVGVGGLMESDFREAPLDEGSIRDEIELNLTVPILTVNRFLPLLSRSPSACIVLIGSGFGWSPSGRAPVYSAAKAGIRLFAQSLRAQLAPKGIHVLELVPPLVDTPAVSEVTGRKLSPEVVARKTLEGVLHRRAEVFPGAARAIPLMLRLAPRILRRMTLRT